MPLTLHQRGEQLICLLALGTWSTQARAWPSEDEWAPLLMGGTEVTDASDDVENEAIDLVDGQTGAAIAWATDGTEVFFSTTVSGELTYNAKTGACGPDLARWEFFLDTDDDEDQAELIVTASCAAGSLEGSLTENAAHADGLWISGTTTVSALSPSADEVRIDHDGEHDRIGVSIPAQLLSWSGLDLPMTATQGMRVIAMAVTVGESEWDIGGTAEDDVMPWSDWIGVDRDEDGLVDSQEQLLGADPMDPDTDGDGVLDGDDEFPLVNNSSTAVDPTIPPAWFCSQGPTPKGRLGSALMWMLVFTATWLSRTRPSHKT